LTFVWITLVAVSAPLLALFAASGPTMVSAVALTAVCSLLLVGYAIPLLKTSRSAASDAQLFRAINLYALIFLGLLVWSRF
jgi:hypothetical protein